MDFPINDFPEITNPVSRADGYKICGIPAVVPVLHTGRWDTVSGLEFVHIRNVPFS